MSVTIVGKSSFLARSIQEKLGDNGWTYISHQEALADPSWVGKTACVVNFAFPPAFKTERYRESGDIDLKLARMIAGAPVHYIMVSTRLVYGQRPANFRINETQPLDPKTPYARNKLVTEANLHAALPSDRLTVLRLANIFGHELNRPLFFGRMLTSLKESGKIAFDMSAKSQRDFFAVWHLADALDIITRRPHPGIYNLGSGVGTPCGDIARWVIEGYGSGTLEVYNDTLADQFWFDLSLARRAWPALPVITPEIIRADCLDCGQWLRSSGG